VRPGNAEGRVVAAVGRPQVIQRNLRIVTLNLHVKVVLERFLDAIL